MPLHLYSMLLLTFKVLPCTLKILAPVSKTLIHVLISRIHMYSKSFPMFSESQGPLYFLSHFIFPHNTFLCSLRPLTAPLNFPYIVIRALLHVLSPFTFPKSPHIIFYILIYPLSTLSKYLQSMTVLDILQILTITNTKI